MRTFTGFALLFGIALLALPSASRLGAGDKKDKGPPPPPPPGPEHKLLKDLVGTFETAVTFFADGKKIESKGLMKRQMMLKAKKCLMVKNHGGRSFHSLHWQMIIFIRYSPISLMKKSALRIYAMLRN